MKKKFIKMVLVIVGYKILNFRKIVQADPHKGLLLYRGAEKLIEYKTSLQSNCLYYKDLLYFGVESLGLVMSTYAGFIRLNFLEDFRIINHIYMVNRVVYIGFYNIIYGCLVLQLFNTTITYKIE